MANDNETVKQIYTEAMETTGVFPSRQTYAKRYLAAHNREMAAKDEEIAQLNKSVERWMEYHDTMKCERDAFLDEIKKRDAEIVKLRALVNGLADVVSTARPKFCNGCPGALCSLAGEPCGFVSQADELVAKAREETK